jgi:hypothetical protein
MTKETRQNAAIIAAGLAANPELIHESQSSLVKWAFNVALEIDRLADEQWKADRPPSRLEKS